MRILLLGNTGQLGWEAERCLAPLGEVTALDYPQVDFCQPETLFDLVREVQPQVIFNAAAYTAVDRAESEPERCHKINAEAPAALAEAANAIGAALVHISTDFVYDGTKGTPYTEADAPNPLSVYGRTKLEGDLAVLRACRACLVLRTAWVYSRRRDSFVSKVLEWAKGKPTLRVVADQVSNPTWARMLAQAIALALAQGGADPAGWAAAHRGVYHLAGGGYASRMEWAQEILRLAEGEPRAEVLPARTEDFPTPARRPLFSALDCTLFERTFGLRLPPWRQAMRWMMD